MFRTRAERDEELVQLSEQLAHTLRCAGSVGAGVREIRIRDESGAYRVLYVAKFEEAVYVLHCFQKKTQATPKRDIALAEKRFRDLVEERRK